MLLVLGVLCLVIAAALVGVVVGGRYTDQGWAAYIVRHGGLVNEPTPLPKREGRLVPPRNY